jgi:uncharacterized membrane protein
VRLRSWVINFASLFVSIAKVTMFNPARSLFDNIVASRNRFVLSLLVAIFAYWLLPLPHDYDDIRVITAYILGVSVHLGLIITMMVFSTAEATLQRASRREPSNIVILVLILLLSVITLSAIAVMLNNSQHRPPLIVNIHMALSLLAIFLSWLFVHTYFALHYARIYYQQKNNVPNKTLADDTQESFVGGLDFPTSGLADYWDFLYYSFTIAMCYQTSDISVTSVVMRRITLFHSIISFIYVSSIIGLVVNLVSNIV